METIAEYRVVVEPREMYFYLGSKDLGTVGFVLITHLVWLYLGSRVSGHLLAHIGSRISCILLHYS